MAQTKFTIIFSALFLILPGYAVEAITTPAQDQEINSETEQATQKEQSFLETTKGKLIIAGAILATILGSFGIWNFTKTKKKQRIPKAPEPPLTVTTLTRTETNEIRKALTYLKNFKHTNQRPLNLKVIQKNGERHFIYQDSRGIWQSNLNLLHTPHNQELTDKITLLNKALKTHNSFFTRYQKDHEEVDVIRRQRGG
jgi:hypothetical protein